MVRLRLPSAFVSASEAFHPTSALCNVSASPTTVYRLPARLSGKVSIWQHTTLTRFLQSATRTWPVCTNEYDDYD